MKVISQEKNPSTGNKGKNIQILATLGIKIPETIIITHDLFYKEAVRLKKNTFYILRPSIENEDGETKSLAGYTKSLYPLSDTEVINIFQNHARFSEIFQTHNQTIKSIIVQEYISSGQYGVYFTRDPLNILRKWYIESSLIQSGITSGNSNPNNTIPYFQRKELEHIGYTLEKYYQSPQDIEFCIKDGDIIIFQTRPITTGNINHYSFPVLQKITWVYKTLDFDELWEIQDMFSYTILSKLFTCLYLDSKIYFKVNFFPSFFFRRIKSENIHLHTFYKEYRKYLFFKYIFSILRFLSFQSLDKKVLVPFFRKYSYSFLWNKKSNLWLNFTYKTNFLTRLFLCLEKQKQKAFISLEEYKKKAGNTEILPSTGILRWYDILLFYKGILISQKHDSNIIYPGKIEWILTDIAHFNPHSQEKQVIVCTTLDLDLWDKFEWISGVIVQKGWKLSHNAILLREYKIPSRVHYSEFTSLKIGERVSI